MIPLLTATLSASDALFFRFNSSSQKPGLVLVLHFIANLSVKFLLQTRPRRFPLLHCNPLDLAACISITFTMFPMKHHYTVRCPLFGISQDF